MTDKEHTNDSLIISYLTLRKIVGILGISLPFVLVIGAAFIFSTGMRSSMSGYYHTGMHDVFVGTLCVIGFFLFSYKGHERIDDIAGDLACLFAIGVALFPTTPDPTTLSRAITFQEKVIGSVHYAFAALFFLTLIYFSLCLFTKTSASAAPSTQKLQRNRIYKICGYTMSACVLFIAIHAILSAVTQFNLKTYAPVFWLEGIAVVAFGISWLTKGETLFKDRTED